MKIIDEKGRLFGKINIIDFLVILFLFSFTPMLYFGYKIFTRKALSAFEPRELMTIKVDCSFIRIKPETLRLISNFSDERDAKGNLIGRIVWVGSDKPYMNIIILNGNNDVLYREDPVLRELPVKLELLVEKINNVLFYRGQPIQFGSTFVFQNQKYSVDVRLSEPLNLSIIDRK